MAWGVLGIALGIAAISGIGRVVWRPAPFVLAGSVILSYVVLIAWLGIRAAQCPGCVEGDGDRVYYLRVFAYIYGVAALGAVAAIAFGAFFGARARRSGA